MKRIVMINTVCTGSHGRIMADLGRRAEELGHEVSIAFGRGEANHPDCIRIGSQAGVLTHVALTRAFDRHARGSLFATRRLVRQLQAIRPDLIHLHNAHGYYLHAPTLFEYIRAHRIPTLWTLHDCWAFTGHCSHFYRISCEKWKSGCFDCALQGEYPASLGLDGSRRNWAWKQKAFAGHKSLVLATPAKWVTQALSMSFLRDTPRITIPNGVDLGLFRVVEHEGVRASYGVREGQLLLLAVAAPFDERKGFSQMLAIAGQVGERGRVVMVGLTQEQLRGLPGNVVGIARTDGPEALIALYNAADCLINPSCEDTYPTVNMEAIACGTPVVAYGKGGSAEQITDACGMLAPYGDVGALADAAMKIGQEKSTMRDACRMHAERHFDRRNALDEYIAQYHRMMGA